MAVSTDSASSETSSLAHETEASDTALAAANDGRVKETNDLTKHKVELTDVVNTLKLDLCHSEGDDEEPCARAEET